MEGSGFTDGNALNKTWSPPERGPIEIIVIISIFELLELFILVFIIRTSWIDRRSRKSFCHFIISISLLKKCFILSAVIILVLNTIFLVRILLPLEYDDELCSLMLRITGATSYNIAMISVYLYLWVKQYHLQSSPVVKALLPRWLPILSKISLVLVLVTFVLPLVLVWSNGNVSSIYRDGYCYHKSSAVTLFPALMIGATIVTQTVYTVLFYATLKIYDKAMKTSANNNSLRKIAQRCLFFAIVAVVTDIIALVGVQLTGGRIPELYVHLFPKFDIFLNLLCMLFCFNKLPDVMKRVVSFVTCGKIIVGNDNESNSNRQTVTAFYSQSRAQTKVWTVTKT
ncbi:uncharacterized protein LOC143464525 isoform X1 [Clavelina lepadiformis]|uniref:uncharacterized protein LOC143464525 isoform X1 n=1 Tax=Clavelina lepadiformis TaxID=159417 RepID=UPI00404136AE